MAFDKQHWNDPRLTIATIYKDNDYGYVMHAAKTVSEIERHINLPPKELATTTILDYGCGTGRMSVILSYKFKTVLGYDPTPNCILMAEEDRTKVNFNCNNLTFTTDNTKLVPADYTCSVSVLEHLDEQAFLLAIRDIADNTKIGAVLWYSTRNNPLMVHFVGAERMAQPSANASIRVEYITATDLKNGMSMLFKIGKYK